VIDLNREGVVILKKLFILIAIVILSLSACGRNRNNDVEENGRDGSLNLTQGTYSLTVSVPIMSEARFRRAGEALRLALADEGIYLDFHIDYFMEQDWEEHGEHLLGRFAAGVGPDIFTGGFSPLPIYRFIENGFLADIYELMGDRRDEYFTNVLQPLEIGGRLYTLPIQFGFDHIGINPNAPSKIIERFAALEYATPSTLMELYFDAGGSLAFFHGLWVSDVFIPELNTWLDFAEKTVNIPDNAAAFLENLQLAFRGNDRFGTQQTFPVTDEFLAQLQERYLFYRPMAFGDNTRPREFLHYIPLSDEDGRLVQRGFSGTHLNVNSTANPALAWAFIELVINDAATDEFRHTLDIPIARRYTDETFDAPTNYRTNFVTLPAPTDAFFEFIYGDLSIEDTIAQLRTDIITWMNEPRPITPYAPSPEETNPWLEANLPTRTLTIQTSNRNTAVLEQAAEALNAAWWERGEGYVLQLEIDDYPWIDTDGIEARNTRLQTQLMAGQGPDIFTFTSGLNLHALARSGFIAEIGELIDACPHTSRDDFFMQALHAYEVGGGLFLFPTNFTFHYVGINTNLPQTVIDRFSQQPTTTFAQMMELYMYVMENYADEFGHMFLGIKTTAARGMVDAIHTLESGAGEFIDFNTRTANLTDPRFISFLELLARVEAHGQGLFFSWGLGGHGGGEWRTERAEEAMFMMENSQLMPLNVFLDAVDPPFYHHAVLTDNQGRLLLDDVSVRRSQSTWATYAITSTGEYTLAWEFLQYVTAAYSEPVGRSGICPEFGAPVFGSHHLTSTTQRALFEGHAHRAFNYLFHTIEEGFSEGEFRYGTLPLDFTNAQNPTALNREIEAGITRMAELNEMPMSMLTPMIPHGLFSDDLELFMLGIITASDFAQRMQNSVSLWLIE